MLKRTSVLFIVVSVILTSLYFPITAEAYDGVAELTIFSTSDLHGQSIRYSYDTASDHIGSLAQISTVIKKEKKKIKYGTSLLVDTGDVVFGRAAETINSGEFTGIQYMYKIMKKMGYDAITLGNHDFDYGFSYIRSALSSSGLSDKVVLSNVVNAKSKRKVFATSRIIEKKVRTSKGVKKTIRIGITGAVTPNLGTFSDLTGEVETQDIVNCVREEVKKLKNKKADVIIVLSHSGLGKMRTPKKMEEHVSYHLAQISGVDVVCAGHSHQDYPSRTSSNAKVFTYDFVDEDTGMVDETILIEESDHGESLGISKLTLRFYSDGLVVEPKSAHIRKIKDSDVEDPKVVKWNRSYDKKYRQMYDATLSKTGGITDNYFGTIEDNSLIQFANEAKISYGIKKINELAPEYSSCPVISSTYYKNTGSISKEDYIVSDGDVTYATLLKLQAYGQKYARAHYLTGTQLRECLEWCVASAYVQSRYAPFCSWKDPKINEFYITGEYVPVISPEWEDWTGFTVFDGVEYTIDTSGPAKYDKSGNIINPSARRISQISVNGKVLKDNDKVILISNTVQPEDGILPSLKNEISNQLVFGKTKHLTDIIYEYLAEQSMGEVVPVREDSNWEVVFEGDKSFFIKSSVDAIEKAKDRRWYDGLVYQDTDYAFFLVNSKNASEDVSGPFLVASKTTDEIQGEPIEIKVQASDRSGVSSISYARGVYGYDDVWISSGEIVGGSFFAKQNDIYTVRAVDYKGNISLRYITVTNINASAANTPQINSITNLDTEVSGNVSAGAEVFITVGNECYTAQAGDDGKFECEIGHVRAEEKVIVYQIDSKGRKSVEVEITVARAAANHPKINPVNNKMKKVTGVLKDSKFCGIFAIRNNTIYVPKGQKSLVKKSGKYRKGMVLEETTYRFNSTTKKFALTIPKIYADQHLEVYSYDWLGRESAKTECTVEDIAPNMPVVRKIVAQEGIIYGKIPGIKQGVEYTVTAECNNKKQTCIADENGTFILDMQNLKKGANVSVVVSDNYTGTVRDSLESEKEVIDFLKMGDFDFANARFDPINNKDIKITGHIGKNYGTIIYLLTKNKRHLLTLNSDGEFDFGLKNSLSEGTMIGIISRNGDGSINTFRYTKVKLAKPDEPELLTDEITEDTTRIRIKGVDKADAFLKIGSKKFKATSIKKRGKKYVYTFKVDNLKKKSNIIIWLKNKAGSSKKVSCGKVHRGQL